MRYRRLIYSVFGLLLAVVGATFAVLWASLPKLDGEVELSGLQEKAAVASDDLGIPTIEATGREDAMRILGWIHARDRLFQMELMRRKGAGRLAELFGPLALELDKRQRAYRFEQAARAIVANLPWEQKKTLAAYVDGINAFLRQARFLPPEFLLLRHEPEPWRAEDSLLVALCMFQTLTGEEKDERMLSVMEQALPAEVVRFLTPDTDEYATVLTGGEQSYRPATPIPVEAWVGLGQVGAERVADGVDALSVLAGSNNWTVSGKKTHDGRAILANDMHLSLGVPNIWYRASLVYGGNESSGVTLPGVPLLVVGSNGHVAWGFTNVDADVLDLVRLEINPANPDQYRTPQGWRAFEHQRENIRVKGGDAVAMDLKSTLWGPVSPTSLLGQPVAIHWTALQAAAVDLGLLDMDRADTLEQAMEVMNRSGGPNQNLALADDQGRIAWTILGRYPLRQGFDGSVSRSWADGGIGWDGYIPAERLPRLIDPARGFIATANNRTLGRDYPFVIAHNQANGYRAYRISQRLSELQQADEQDLFAIQLDTRSEFFEFYRRLALEMLDLQSRQDPLLEESRRYIEAWNGHMDADSLGIGLLWRFREKLAEAVFAPAVARCRQLDAGFNYSWREMETPLRALLTARMVQTLPDARYRDWRELILAILSESARELKQRHEVSLLQELSWGEINRVPIRHPFSKSMPFLAQLLDMQETAFSGCAGFCVRIVGIDHGASERMVVSPAHPQQAILHMPGGQSGHPLSVHYRDQHPAWRDGLPLPFMPGKATASLAFVPRR